MNSSIQAKIQASVIKPVSKPVAGLASANNLSDTLSGSPAISGRENNENSEGNINPFSLNGFGFTASGDARSLTPLQASKPGENWNAAISKSLAGSNRADGVSSTGGVSSTERSSGINPNGYDNFGGDGVQGYYGQNFGNQFAQRDFKETEVPTDSALNSVSGADPKRLWNDIRSNLIGGVFADDQHLNQALNKTLEKFGDQFKDATQNADSLSIATAFNLSKEGLQKDGIGAIMNAYSKIDNNIPEGMLSRTYLDRFSQIAKEGGSLSEALAGAKVFLIPLNSVPY